MRLVLSRTLRYAALTAAMSLTLPAKAQMPTPQEMEEAMREMQRQMQSLTPEQRRMMDQAMQQMPQEATPGADDDEIGVPGRDEARLAKIGREPLTGAQLESHIASLQPKLRQALSAQALGRVDAIEDIERKAGGDFTARLRAAANGLAAWGAWPEATYLMGKVALASGDVQDLSNLAAFLTMQKVPQAALPILITLDARYPDNGTLLNNLGQAWFELGELKEAERVLRLAVRRSPDHPQANLTLSRIEEARGDMAAAQASMHAAIRGGYSEAKAARLRKLGGKPAAGDARWMLNKAAHPLGLSDLAPYAYPAHAAQTVDAQAQWKAYRQRLDEATAQLRAKVARAATQRASFAMSSVQPGMPLRGVVLKSAEMLRFHAPLASLAQQAMRDDEARSKDEAKRVIDALTAAEQFELAERARLERQIEAIRLEGERRDANKPGGYAPETSCKEVVAAQTAYLEKAMPALEHAALDVVGFYRRRIGETANLTQYTVSEAEYETMKDNFRLSFLQMLDRAHGHIMGAHGFFAAGIGTTYAQVCLLNPAARPPKHKLADFDEMNCQHQISFAVPGIGRYDIRCNSASVELDPFALPLKAKWTEDLIKDRVLTASVEIEREVSDAVKVSVGAHGEFDDQGLKNGGAGVQVEAGVGKSGAGPLEIGMGVRGGIGVEIDRSGITDVRIDSAVEAKASSTAAKTDAASSGVEAKTDVSGSWSWNGGASAGVSGDFNRKAF